MGVSYVFSNVQAKIYQKDLLNMRENWIYSKDIFKNI